MSANVDTGPSVIHDIGYQRYTGARLGRGYAARSLFVHGLRTAFGLGRSAKAKIFPWIVVGIVAIVAVVVTAVSAQAPEPIMTYYQFPENMTMLIILFCAVVGPELVSRDLRSGVLPLYFSRPLERSDYALAKLGALVAAVWLMLASAQLLMFVGAAFSGDGIRAVWNEFLDLLGAVGYSGIYALLFSAISILVASLASRRAVAAAIIVAVFLVTTPVVGVLYAVGGDTAQQLASLASPMTMVGGVGDWLFGDSGDMSVGDYGPLYTGAVAALVILCGTALLARYRKVGS
jgi:ABC-2 type transport system permease protein